MPTTKTQGAGQSKIIVLITGGSGFLAFHIAKLIHSHWRNVQEIRLFDPVAPEKTQITSITGYSTSPSKPKVSYFPGDVLNNDSLLSSFVKVDVVIHCAAIVENGSVFSRRKMKKVNIEGTRNVIQACFDCGVRGLVFTGSTAQAFRSTKTKVVKFDEANDFPSEGELLFPYYGGTKNAAERLVLEANGQLGKDQVKLYTCSLRCPPMFGENDKTVAPTALRAAKRCCGYYIPITKSSVTIQCLYVGNSAWAHVCAAQRLLDEHTRVSVGGSFYYIGDHSPVCNMTHFVAQFLTPMGYRVAPIRVPYFLMLLLAYFIEFLVLVFALVRIELKLMLNRGAVHYMKLSHSFSWEKARRDLQYEPLFSHDTALVKSVEYYRQNL